MFIVASCSKDDTGTLVNEKDFATLTFGAVINDLINKKDGLKQAIHDLPECSDATPSYVAVAMSGTAAVGTIENPLIVSLSITPGDFNNDGDEEYVTMESPDLELEPGAYSLDFFAVYDDNDNLLWLAPTEGGGLSDWVNALPLEFDLGAGVKKYLDVDVLCYDVRYVSQYGYLFVDLEPTEVLEFCVYGNICGNDGMHEPAQFRFDVWTYSGDPEEPHGVALFNENDPFINTVGVTDDGDPYADALCVFLPDTPGEDLYYGEISIIEDGSTRMIRHGHFSDANVREFFIGEDRKDFYHFREGNCNIEDSHPIFDEAEAPGRVIDADTNIYIYVDSSGSMFNAQYTLQMIYYNNLKDILISRYNNDESLYEEKVKFILDASGRTFDFLNLEGENPDGNVIVMVFQDDAEYVYHSGSFWDENTPRTRTFDEDITALRERLVNTRSGYDGIIFQVGNISEFNEEANVAYQNLITYVENGIGNYSGAYGLSDRNEISYVYDVAYSSIGRSYYLGLIGDTLEELGYDFW